MPQSPILPDKALFFRAGDRLYALPASGDRGVTAVLPASHIVPVPRLPPPIIAAAPFRRAVIPVVDPAWLLGLEPSRPLQERTLVVLPKTGGFAGIAVDAVERTFPTAEAAFKRIVTPPDMRTPVLAAAVVGDDPVLLLDPDILLSADRPFDARIERRILTKLGRASP